MKGVVFTPRKFCWHLITKRKEGKNWRSLRVILKERDLCDIDRITDKRGCLCWCAQQHTVSFRSNGSACERCHAALCLSSAPFALTHLWRLLSEADGKTNPSKIKPCLFSYVPLSGLLPHSTLSTPSVLHLVKAPIKTLSSSGQEPVKASLLLFSHRFSWSDRVFSCQAKHLILFSCGAGAAGGLQITPGRSRDRQTTVYFICYL